MRDAQSPTVKDGNEDWNDGEGSRSGVPRARDRERNACLQRARGDGLGGFGERQHDAGAVVRVVVVVVVVLIFLVIVEWQYRCCAERGVGKGRVAHETVAAAVEDADGSLAHIKVVAKRELNSQRIAFPTTCCPFPPETARTEGGNGAHRIVVYGHHAPEA